MARRRRLDFPSASTACADPLGQSLPAPAHPPRALVTIVGPESEAAFNAILIGPRGWRRRNTLAPVFDDRHGTRVTIGDPTETLDAENEKRAWDIVLALDDLTALTLLFVIGKYLAVNNDPAVKRPVSIQVNEILDWMGFARHRNGDHKQEHKIAERRRFATLRSMSIRQQIDDPPSRSGRKKGKKTFSTSPLISVTYFSQEEQTNQALPFLESPDAAVGVPYEFLVDLGFWAAPYITRGELRVILAHILSYGSSRKTEHRFAMRFGVLLHFQDFAENGTVLDLLNAAHIEPPHRDAAQFRDDFESALDRLVSDNLLGSWHYQDADELPMYRWVNDWLLWRIKIVPAPRFIVTSTSAPALTLGVEKAASTSALNLRVDEGGATLASGSAAIAARIVPQPSAQEMATAGGRRGPATPRRRGRRRTVD